MLTVSTFFWAILLFARAGSADHSVCMFPVMERFNLFIVTFVTWEDLVTARESEPASALFVMCTTSLEGQFMADYITLAFGGLLIRNLRY
jgi:hypothetical protein